VTAVGAITRIGRESDALAADPRVVVRPVWAYLPAMIHATASRTMSRPLMVAAGVGAALLAGTVALWADYGTAVFFETIRAGFISCFG